MGDLLQRAMGFWRSRRQPRHALALAGGGVIGGMYEVGAVAALERFMRDALEKRGLRNAFGELEPTLLIPAIELERAQRVVFGKDALRDVPISQAVAASSAIPGFFEPYEINGRDYVDGGVGFSGQADLAAEEGASVVVVINPLVPNYEKGLTPLRNRGLYAIMEQAGRI